MLAGFANILGVHPRQVNVSKGEAAGQFRLHDATRQGSEPYFRKRGTELNGGIRGYSLHSSRARFDGDNFDARVHDVGCGELVLMTNMRSAATGPAGSTM
jgi:hypothetical protein